MVCPPPDKKHYGPWKMVDGKLPRGPSRANEGVPMAWVGAPKGVHNKGMYLKDVSHRDILTS